MVQGKGFLGSVIVPIYVFECRGCGEQVEVLQSMNAPWPDCEPCKETMRKKPVLTSFRLEGSGWARDNYGLKE